MKVNINDIVNVIVELATDDGKTEVQATRRREPILEEVCDVCKKYVEVGYHHSLCYTVVERPPLLEDNSGEIVVRFE